MAKQNSYAFYTQPNTTRTHSTHSQTQLSRIPHAAKHIPRTAKHNSHAFHTQPNTTRTHSTCSQTQLPHHHKHIRHSSLQHLNTSKNTQPLSSLFPSFSSHSALSLQTHLSTLHLYYHLSL